MAAARDRVTTTGEDGWAAAYTLALTLPPASGCYDAVGARDVLVPDTLPDEFELARLERATPEEDDESGGYYGEPNIDHGNLDMAHSMVRRARPSETVRPDLRCPKCCQAAGDEDEAGMPGQVYRCTDCGDSWEYHSPSVSEDDPFDPDEALLTAMPLGIRERVRAFRARWAPQGVTLHVQWTPASEEETERRRARDREVIARAFGVPTELLGPPVPLDELGQPLENHWRSPDTRPDQTVLIASNPDPGPYPRPEWRGLWGVQATAGGMLREPEWAWPEEPETPEQAAEREAREAGELRDALEFASRNPTTDQAIRRTGMVEARRRGYVRELIPGRRRAGQTRRIALTAFGRAVYLRLRRTTNSR
jgi:hypothetical protein